jgi:hypothetical protein
LTTDSTLNLIFLVKLYHKTKTLLCDSDSALTRRQPFPRRIQRLEREKERKREREKERKKKRERERERVREREHLSRRQKVPLFLFVAREKRLLLLISV